MRRFVFTTLAFSTFVLLPFWAISQKEAASKPLFRDPHFDGAADPVVIWNQAEEKWFMFYTNRRASLKESRGVEWVHGTRIGVAESTDGGRTWTYRDTCNIPYGKSDYSHWAPEVIEHEGLYHMYLTVVPGTFADWKHPRSIIHLTSRNLLDWKFVAELPLVSDKVIDACVYPKPGGGWRMYYNNERDNKSIYFADSPDLFEWKDAGKKAIGDRRGEGPKVVFWKGKYRMFVDVWKGIGVYSSEEMETWTAQEGNLLQEPGKGEDDKVKGGHPDVVVNGKKAYIFYFTHPGRTPENKGKDGYEMRRSSIQVAELKYKKGKITCDRNAPVFINLKPNKVKQKK